MKRKTAIIIFMVVCMALTACGKAGNRPPMSSTAQTNPSQNQNGTGSGNSYEVGDHMTFGSNAVCNTWTVLEKEEDEILILCDDVVYSSSYYAKSGDDFEHSYPYVWMNQTFVVDDFNVAEQQAMVGSFFLLSRREIENYMPKKKDRKVPSEKGYWIFDDTHESANYDAIDDSGAFVEWGNSTMCGIRPAIWVTLQ